MPPRAPLNVQPTGLLAFLDIKNAGQYPQSLGTDLVPTYELAEHYLQVNGRLVYPASVALASGTNQLYNIDTPVENWRYYNWAAGTWDGNNVADFIVGGLVMYEPNTGRVRMLGPYPSTIDNAAGLSHRAFPLVAEGDVYRGFVQAEKFYLPPSWGLALYQASGTSTAGLAVFNPMLSRIDLRA